MEQLELLHAQGAREVGVAVVAGQEGGEVEGLGGAEHAVRAAVARLFGSGLDLGDPDR
ncbi:hypothetical protein [Actinomadura flavalba]|uniref:hypothetical protein n=1 Tax=Actinomadura flavalba TaxID=1120938 RepID=UPI0012DDDF56|nr:hypothetical protein [Actinomadura flavalba]